ncbi:MAG: GntR family transcriptional regulator [Firmicutes bacterium]|nr:GntR family transcriptional regulator [Bacillota bacterium]
MGNELRLCKVPPIPLYYQLKEIIRQQIEDGIYKPGDAIPNETELQEKYKLSRSTVRKAVEELVADGLLIKRQGKGTFVQKPKITQNLNLITSFGETLVARGLTPKISNVEVEEIPAPAKIAQMLGLNVGDPVIHIFRLYLADDDPIALMTNYLIPQLVPGLSREDLCKYSLYQILEHKYDLTLATADETMEARCADEYEADMLNVVKGAPLLHVTRVTYSLDGSPIEVAIVTSRADRYSYSIKLSGREKSKRLIGISK